ncbi:MFS transporter [Rhodococcus hoagii]|nr:MFS transporter [Prescottella equi]
MMVSMSVMVSGSLLAAIGGTFVTVLIGRGMQGFASSLIAVGIGILRDELPREKVPAATALMSATLGMGSALGLPLAGVIYPHWAGTRFWISAAAGAVMMLLLSRSSCPNRRSDRPAGSTSSAPSSCRWRSPALLRDLQGGAWGWGSTRTLGCFALAAVVLAIWIPYQLRVTDPMVNLRTSARRRCC